MRENLPLGPEEQFIFLIADIRPVQKILQQLDELIPNIRDWDFFTKTAIDRAAAPLIVDKLHYFSNSSLFPEKVLRNLKQASLITLSRNMLLTEHFGQVVGAFCVADVPVVALKGSMLSEWLYGNINLRQFSDLDLLVPPEKGLEALSILQTMGYRSNEFSMSDFIKEHTSIVHYAPMVKNGVSVEIHIRLHAETEHFQVDLKSMWRDAVPLTLHGVSAFGLCPDDLLIHLCIHLDKHFRSGKFQFTCLYDLVNMLNHKADVLNWDVIEEKCVKANAVKETFKYLILVHKYMNAQLPAVVVEKYSSLVYRKDERILLGILRGKGVNSYTSSVMRSLVHINGLGERFRYLFELFFPSVEFMMKRYRLKRKGQLLIYYPYRHFSAARNLWLSLKKAFS